MQTNNNYKLLISLSIAVAIAFSIVILWTIGDSVFIAIVNATVPENSPFSMWKVILIALWACVFAILTEKYSFQKIIPVAISFSVIWFIFGLISLNVFSVGLAVFPIIFAVTLSLVFIHLKKLWEIDERLTEKLISLSTEGNLLQGKSTDLRIESSLQLLETIFPVSEIVVFRYELNGVLTPIGRARKNGKDNSPTSRQNSWKKCVTLCEEAIESRETKIKNDELNKDTAQIALPLISDKILIGVLFIDVQKDFVHEDKYLLESFSQQLARNLQRHELRNKKLPHNSWWDSFSSQSLENRLDITSLLNGIIEEQSFGTLAVSYLKEAHAIAYLDGTLAYVNQRMKQLANLKSEDIPNTDLFKLLGRFKTDIFNDPSLAIRRVMQTGDSFKCELNFPEQAKTIGMQINLVKVPAQSKDIHTTNTKEVPACFLITFRNISVLKENVKLRSDMAHLMSHELRTPITSIQGFAEMLLLEDNLPEDSKEFLNTIAAESQRASKVLTNFLSVANLQQSDKQEVIKTSVEVNDVVHKVVNDYQKTAKQKRIRIVEKQGKEITPIAADRGLITKAISHLIDNAIRYSPERTSVIISTALEADFLRVDVEDRGYGIPSGEQEKIWQKFYRVIHEGQEKQEDTTGLGLSLVKEIVEQHDGEVGVKSIVGRGSRFSFRLPRL